MMNSCFATEGPTISFIHLDRGDAFTFVTLRNNETIPPEFTLCVSLYLNVATDSIFMEVEKIKFQYDGVRIIILFMAL